MTASPNRVYAAVAAAALVAHLGALANHFAGDDFALVVQNPIVMHGSGVWRAFVAPYWPPVLGGQMYRPLPVASWTLDYLVDGAVWYHLVNLVWHAGACVAVAALARRLADERAALVAGLLFAVHPVHVEAIANVVGRNELMAGLFVVLGVYAAVAWQSVGWSATAWALGLLCKENAAVLPALVAGSWALGLAQPSRRQKMAFVASWVVVGAVYAAVRWVVLRPYEGFEAPIFFGASPGMVRLTAVAALADVARLLVFPLTLRADYSPAERTLVTSPLDARFAVGMACLLAWAALVALAWRGGRRVEAYGLGWIGFAFLPVANLVFPAGVLIAERTLYLPSVGFVVAAGAALARLPAGRVVPVVAALVLLGGVRSALRVPVWRDTASLTLSILEDSPRSYAGPRRMIPLYLDYHQPAKALEAARLAVRVYPFDPSVYTVAAVAAFASGESRAADSLLTAFQRVCHQCLNQYRLEIAAARRFGYPAAADSLEARARLLEAR